MPGGGADRTTFPDTFCLIHDPRAVRDDFHIAPEDFESHQDGEELGAVDGLDRAREGPGRRVRLGVPRPERAGSLPEVGVLGAHCRRIGIH